MSAADRWRTSAASIASTAPSQSASPVRGRSVGFGVGGGVGGWRPKPTTSTGASRPEKVPSPRRPSAFQPQHWRPPLAPMAHVWELPAAISTMSVARRADTNSVRSFAGPAMCRRGAPDADAGARRSCDENATSGCAATATPVRDAPLRPIDRVATLERPLNVAPSESPSDEPTPAGPRDGEQLDEPLDDSSIDNRSGEPEATIESHEEELTNENRRRPGPR